MADYEARFSALGRYAPYIFDNPCRKLRKFIDGLMGNIRRYVGMSDLESFTRALRMAHLAKRENERFVAKQKSTGKRLWSAPTNRQKDKQIKRTG